MNTERIWTLWAKRKSGEATATEIAELNTLLQGIENNTGNEVFEKIWDAPLNSLPEMKPGEDLWKKIEQNINEPQKTITLYKRNLTRWLVAASVVIIAGAGILLALNQNKNTGNRITQSVATTTSSKKQLILPDGTQVWLNSNSELVYDKNSFGKTYREVKLIGEAFFDVTKDAHHPFIIHAATINITVKGTAFNVKAYPGQKKVETSLIRGLVEITTQQDPERKILLKPNEKISVSTGRELKQPLKETESPLFAISKLHIDEEDMLPETVWMNNSLSFDNEPLEKLAPKLESWFSVTIHMNDEVLKTKRFSGTIQGETLEQTLDALKISYPFSYTIKNSEVWINK